MQSHPCMFNVKWAESFGAVGVCVILILGLISCKFTVDSAPFANQMGI